MRPNTYRDRQARRLSRVLALWILVTVVPAATGSPGDIQQLAAPTLGSDPPKARDIADGDASVATLTGGLGYQYPITLPPGRAMAPSLALTYSSQAAIYGGLAAGWSLSGVHDIRWDTSNGRLRYEPQLMAAVPPAYWADEPFTSSLVGGRPLVHADGDPADPVFVFAAYRGQNDSRFQRFQRMKASMPYRWRVLTPEGVEHRFGEESFIANATPALLRVRAPLTSSRDGFGNTVEYYWNYASDELRIDQIRYTVNAAAAVPYFARVDFVYGANPACAGIPIGSQSDFKTGVKLVDGASRLSQIVATALDPQGNDVHVRQITLGYAASTETCGAGATHSPYRQLASIQESAWHVAAPERRVDLPEVRFEYGSATIAPTVPAAMPAWSDLGWGRRYAGNRWPTVEATMLDFDGDSLLDRVFAEPIVGTTTECGLRWQRNLGEGVFDVPSEVIQLPRLPWSDNAEHPNASYPEQGEACSLNYQRTDYWNVDLTSHLPNCAPVHEHAYLAYRFIDMTGDGKVELVTAIHHDVWLDPTQPGGPWPGGPWPVCPGDEAACPALTADCMRDAQDCLEDQPCVIKPNRAAACMAEASLVPCHLMTAKQARPDPGGSPYECTFDGTNIVCPDPPLNPECPFPPPNKLHGFKLGCNLYPWTIYSINPSGTLGPPQTILQPQELESDTGDSSMSGGGGFFAGQKAVTDLDGDGFIDSVFRGRYDPDGADESDADPIWWWGFHGDGRGGFRKDASGKHIASLFHVPENDVSNISFWISRTFIGEAVLDPPPATGGYFDISSDQQIADMNGDGAVDYLSHYPLTPPVTQVYFNDGLKFRNLGDTASGEPEVTITGLRGLTRSRVIATELIPGGDFVVAGERTARVRLIDLDADGRSDVARATTETPESASLIFDVQYNAGGDLLPTLPPNAGINTAVSQLIRVDGLLPDDNVWRSKRDLVDLDGDGLPEAIDFEATPLRRRHDHQGKPPRLLTTIKNGRGATTNILYAPMSDGSVVKTPNRTSPRTGWVVKSLETVDAFESPSTTTYEYRDPVFNADDEGRFSFRGFEEVIARGPRGNETVERYLFGNGCLTGGPCDLATDWSGRLVATLEKLDANTVDTITEQTYELRQLFGITIQTYHPTETTTYKCRAAQSETACKADPAGLTYSKSTWAEKEGTTTPGIALMWIESERTTQDHVGAMTDGDRKSVTTSVLYTGDPPCPPTCAIETDTTYRLRTIQVDSKVKVAGADDLYASTQTSWDPAFLVAEWERTQLDSAGTLAITHRTYDPQTGNVLTVTKPNQVAASGPTSTNVYDSRKLFVARVTDEMQLVHETDYEYGTGAVIEERSINTCIPNCPPDPDPPAEALPDWEGRRTRVDGLGRPVEQDETFTFSGNGYQWITIEKLAYVDAATPLEEPTVPTSVTDEKRVEYATDRWTETKTELDGHGRPIKVTEEVFATAPVDAVTTYDYDVDGTLIAVSVPDPTQNNASQVTFTYTYDALGRPTGMRRPDHTDPAQQSGVNVTYDGLVETRTEVAGAAGGSVATTTLTTDVFGRLVSVRELPAPALPTTYSYSPRDEVTTITDPEGVVTQLEHDLAGRRTKISRGARVWIYGYDLNGNMISEITPIPDEDPPPSLVLAYTTSFAYDDLDRLTSKLIAPRQPGDEGLSEADRALFGTHVVNQIWDGVYFNGEGRITNFNTKAPDNSTVYSGRYFYDGAGNVTTEHRNWTVAGVVFPQRGETNGWAPFGKVKGLTFADGLPGGEASCHTTTIFDDRGNPKQLNLTRAGITGNNQVAVQTRNVAGLVTKRRTNQTGQAMTFVESNWTYDKLGRVTSQVVQNNLGATPIARQDLTYWGGDDPKWLDQEIEGTADKRLEFGYDTRHQLVDVAETAAGGAFSGDYAFDDAGRFATADVSAAALAGSEVRAREVEYLYSPTDPEQVVELRITTPGPLQGTPYAQYWYDAAGNQIQRRYFTDAAGALLPSPQTWRFQYDGEDQLRRVVAPDGSLEEYWYDQNAKRALIRKLPAPPATGPIEWRWFHNNSEIQWTTDDPSDTTPEIVETWAYASMGTPVARIQNRNDRTEFQFHGLASSTLATVESGVGVLETGDPTPPASGTINAAFTYSPWGEVIETVGAETGTHRRRLNDKYHDAATGLAYYGFRYYDQVAMTWTQADPLYRFAPDAAWREPRRAQLYTFSLQGPTRYQDPDGRNPWYMPELEIIKDAAIAAVRGQDVSGLQTKIAVSFALKAAGAAGLIAAAAPAAAAGEGIGAEVLAMGRATAPPADVVAIEAGAASGAIEVGAASGGIEAGAAGAAVAARAGGGALAIVARHAKSTTSKGTSTGKADTLKPGAFATESIPARGPGRDFRNSEREAINAIGSRDGCHTCGDTTPGTKSGNFILDHQPPNKLATPGEPQRLYPHCKDCSNRQGGVLSHK